MGWRELRDEFSGECVHFFLYVFLELSVYAVTLTNDNLENVFATCVDLAMRRHLRNQHVFTRGARIQGPVSLHVSGRGQQNHSQKLSARRRGVAG